MADDAVILDAENYRNKENFSYREIVLSQVRKIANIYSQELTAGFFKYGNKDQYGNKDIVQYISDGRKSFIQAVEILHDLLLAKFDDVIKKEADDIDAEMISEHENLKDRTDRGEKIRKDYWLEKKVEFSRMMFQCLCGFLERLGWLEEGSIED